MVTVRSTAKPKAKRAGKPTQITVTNYQKKHGKKSKNGSAADIMDDDGMYWAMK